MARITSLISRLKTNSELTTALPDLTLKQGEIFGWDHNACVITYDPAEPEAEQLLLHEIGHALLGHADYQRDIELIEMEAAAWERARQLAAKIGSSIDDDLAEDMLDTYRDWLHARSKCPHCSAIGIQTKSSEYRCLACRHTWRVNEARTCALRRYQTTKKRS